MTDFDDRLADYADVAQRRSELRETFPSGSLQPNDRARPFEIVTVRERTFVVVVAACYRTPDDLRPGIGMAWQEFPGSTPYTRGSELMNAETSAWGRAIVAALAADSKKIASADEVRAATLPARATQDDMDRIRDAFEALPEQDRPTAVQMCKAAYWPDGRWPIAADDVTAVLDLIADVALGLPPCEPEPAEAEGPIERHESERRRAAAFYRTLL